MLCIISKFDCLTKKLFKNYTVKVNIIQKSNTARPKTGLTVKNQSLFLKLSVHSKSKIPGIYLIKKIIEITFEL